MRPRARFVGGALDGQTREDRPGDTFINLLSRPPIPSGLFIREFYTRTGVDEFTYERTEDPHA